jgi:CHAT domain-containing protein/tetratricopeptide (TPR) repeat protein
MAGRWLLIGAACACASVHAAASLEPETPLNVSLAPDSSQSFEVGLRDGAAADLDLVQHSGFVDLELRGDGVAPLRVRTEAGVEGHIEAPLVAARARHWLLIVSARAGKGAATVALRLSAIRDASALDTTRISAFEDYVEAEAMRRANYRETAVTARSQETDAATRGAYQSAEAGYAAAGDGCGVRRTRIGLARMEVAVGNYGVARSLAEAAMGCDCRDDPAERAQALKTLGMAAAYQGDFRASAKAAEEALALYRQTGDERYQGVVLGNLSAVYMQLGATDRALEAANGALRAAEATADGQGVVFSRKSIADIRLARGEFATALKDYRATLTDLATTPYPMVEGETWNDLGIVYHRMGDYPDSLRSYESADAVWRKMRSRGEEADTLINKAQTLLEMSRLRAAVREFDAALAIARADGLKSIETRALRGLGSAHLAEGDPASARSCFLASLALARATGEIAAESYALRAMGELERRQGRFATARRNDESALRLARAAADRDGEAATLAELARTMAATGDLERARTLISRALDIVETQRGRIDDPSLRTSYSASMRAYADTQVDVLMGLDARTPDAGFASAALAAAERARVRSLTDMFAEKSLAVAKSLPPELEEALRSAEERLRNAAFRLGRRVNDSTDAARLLLETEFDQASRALDEVRGRVRSVNPRYAELIHPTDLDLGGVQQQLLDDDVAVVEYRLGEPRSYAWIVTHHAFRAVRLPARAVIEDLCTELGGLLRPPRTDQTIAGFQALAAFDARRASALQAAGGRLGAAVVAPLGRELPRRIAIVADGCLKELPFGILPNSADGRAVGAAHDVSYLPSIAALNWLRRADAAGIRSPSLAIFADPVLSAPAAALPNARAEAQTIAALLPKDRVWLALGAQASRANVLETDWRRYTIVHFAVHAVVDARRPELSGILLSASDPDPQDGMLRMNDIYNLDMPVDLVVLSACDSAAGRDADSEGVFSLSRAFFYAGAPRVIASLWPVDDRASAAFMALFYRALIVEHMSVGSALRFAQQALARDTRWSAPYYWAGFVLQGDWN